MSNIGQFDIEQSVENLPRNLRRINCGGTWAVASVELVWARGRVDAISWKGSVMPVSQERILAGRSYRTGANELREVSAVDQDEVVYHSLFPGSAGLMVRTPDKRLALARFAAEAQSEVERPLHRPNGAPA